MNKKLKVLFSLSLLLSAPMLANTEYNCEEQCEETCEARRNFCGGYVGANFNFGSVNFLSQSAVETALDSYVPFGDGLSIAGSIDYNVASSGLREAINTIGGGVNLGYEWSNSCVYLAAEFNGYFYSNYSANFSCDPCFPNNNGNQYATEISSESDFILNNGDQSINLDLTTPVTRYAHGYQNNVRLDGVVKIGFEVNPSTVVYALGGGSGLPIRYSQSIEAGKIGAIGLSFGGESFNLATSNLTDPANSICCTKWVGGGTVGFGLKALFCDCFDLGAEVRYARYSSLCFNDLKPSESLALVQDQNPSADSDFDNVFGDNVEQSQVKFRPDAFLGSLNFNWRF